MAACSASDKPEHENEKLEELLSKRDSLKTLLDEVNTKIEELDSTTMVVNPIVSAEEVERKSFSHKVEVQGSVETDENALVNAEAQGTVRKVHVKEGQKVRRGQALVTIDAAIISNQIQELETQLELAEFMYEKQKKLNEEGVGTEIELKQAKTQKESLEKSLQTLKSQRGKSTVEAPFTGTVDEVMINVGEMAAPGVPLMRIVNNSDVKVTASLTESLLSKVNEGTDVELVFPSLNDTTIETEVTSRGNFIDPVNRTFRIRMDIKNNKLLLPNQLAKVRVTDFKRDSALVINRQALLQDVQNNTYIYKLAGKEGDVFAVEKVFVKVLSEYKDEACIEPLQKGSLDAKDRIVVAGAKGITESDLVKLQ